MAADGVTVRGGQINISISGLSPGHHTIVTYHNNVSEEETNKLDIDLNGKPFLHSLKPSHRVHDDYDITSAFIPVEVKARERVVIGQGDCAEMETGSLAGELFRRIGAVRKTGVKMEVCKHSERLISPLEPDASAHRGPCRECR